MRLQTLCLISLLAALIRPNSKVQAFHSHDGGGSRGVLAFVLKGVAPAPTGSSAQGFPNALAASAARRMPSTQSGLRVPTLTNNAEAIFIKSSTSSLQCACRNKALQRVHPALVGPSSLHMSSLLALDVWVMTRGCTHGCASPAAYHGW